MLYYIRCNSQEVILPAKRAVPYCVSSLTEQTTCEELSLPGNCNGFSRCPSPVNEPDRDKRRLGEGCTRPLEITTVRRGKLGILRSGRPGPGSGQGGEAPGRTCDTNAAARSCRLAATPRTADAPPTTVKRRGWWCMARTGWAQAGASGAEVTICTNHWLNKSSLHPVSPSGSSGRVDPGHLDHGRSWNEIGRRQEIQPSRWPGSTCSLGPFGRNWMQGMCLLACLLT